VHQIVTPLRGSFPVDAAALEALTAGFERLYERRYGAGSAFRAAGVELVTFRVKARGMTRAPALVPQALGDTDPSRAETGRRRMYVERAGATAVAPTYDFQRLVPGNVVSGPAVIHAPVTTVVVQSEQNARMDEFRNLIVEVDA
jgi:N-methylhydantoinase A